MKADFEEKTFEVAVNHELSQLNRDWVEPFGFCQRCGWLACPFCGAGVHARPATTVQLWAPGQVLENLLGFDVAVSVGGNRQELSRKMKQLVPTGMDWRSHFGQTRGLISAPRWASLFLQYKRPYFLEKPQDNDPLKTHFDGEYYRFLTDTDQHKTLTKLRADAGGLALVLYSSPLFHRNEDFWWYRHQGLVLDQSAFIDVGNDVSHERCGYDFDKSVLCSEPEEGIPYRGAQGISEAIRQTTGERQNDAAESLSAHIMSLASNIASEADRTRTDRLESAVNEILDTADDAGATWILATIAT